MTRERVAVLFMAYGGPDRLDDLPAFLLDVRHGRPYSPELLTDLTERYRAIGGRSPILERTRAEALGIERALQEYATEDGVDYRVYVAMRHWHPFIREVVPEILRDGVDRLVAVVMAPHYSRMSVGAYLARLDEALRDHQATVPVHAVESWKDEPEFIAAWVDRIAAALRAVPETERPRTLLLFTAHSLPTRILDWGIRTGRRFSPPSGWSRRTSQNTSGVSLSRVRERARNRGWGRWSRRRSTSWRLRVLRESCWYRSGSSATTWKCSTTSISHTRSTRCPGESCSSGQRC